jgi:hypothetical protein
MENKISPVEAALVTNDLSKLSTEQRMSYYKSVCESLGLNPLTQPLSYISLNGKLTLYAKRDATDQLRKIHQISINITSRELLGDVYIVTAKAKDASGREDESIGSVSIANLKGDALANAYLKAETKAKRRVTLSICGLGLMDETETETIKEAVLINEPIKIGVNNEGSNGDAERRRNQTNGGVGSLLCDEPVGRQKGSSRESVSRGPEGSGENSRDARESIGIVQKDVENDKKHDELKIYPDKTKIKINKEQAESLKTIGENIGYSVEQISHMVYTLTKKIRWSELNYDEYETIVSSLKDNPKTV